MLVNTFYLFCLLPVLTLTKRYTFQSACMTCEYHKTSFFFSAPMCTEGYTTLCQTCSAEDNKKQQQQQHVTGFRQMKSSFRPLSDRVFTSWGTFFRSQLLWPTFLASVGHSDNYTDTALALTIAAVFYRSVVWLPSGICHQSLPLLDSKASLFGLICGMLPIFSQVSTLFTQELYTCFPWQAQSPGCPELPPVDGREEWFLSNSPAVHFVLSFP